MFALVNLDRNNDQSAIGTNGFNVNVDADADGQNDFGIKRERTYRLRNLASYTGVDATRVNTNFTIVTGATLLDSGLTTVMPKVPSSNAEWATAPYEAQYLKLTDTAPPTAPQAPFLATAYPYWIGPNLTVYWNAVTDAEVGISGYTATATGLIVPTQQQRTTNAATLQATFDSSAYQPADGAQAHFRLVSKSLDGVSSADSPALSVTRLTASGDFDGDGVTNLDEDIAGTNPLSSASKFVVKNVVPLSGGGFQITVPTVIGRTYTLKSSTDLLTWNNEDEALSINISGTGNDLVLSDLNPTGQRKFYRVDVTKP